MGNLCSGKIFSCCQEKEIISDKSLDALEEVVETLRSNVEEVGNGWVFRAGAILHQEIVKELVVALQKGNKSVIRRLLAAGWRFEAAQALYLYLANLKQPLLPHNIQSIVLGENDSVSAELVATDVLGLMKQDLDINHLKLIQHLLGLLNTMIKHSPTDELRGTTLPLSMMPLFFDLQLNQMNDWRRIATIFVEVIRQAENILDFHRSESRLRMINNNRSIIHF